MVKSQFTLINEPKAIAQAIEDAGLNTYGVRGTTKVQIGRSDSRGYLEEIPIEEFIARMKERGLALYEYNGFLKIMKAAEGEEIPSEEGEPEFEGWGRGRW